MGEGETDPDRIAGAHLRELRREAGFTQEGLARLAGLDRETYNKLENGKRPVTLTYAERIAPHVNVRDPTLLLPPQQAGSGAEHRSIADRLQALEDAVAQLLEGQNEILRRILEMREAERKASGARSRRTRGGSGPAGGAES